MTPIAQGVGDRPYPGAYITVEALLRKLGPDDYQKLFTGKLSFADPRVVEVLKWVKELVGRRRLSEELHDAEARRIALLLLQQARRADAADGSFYTGPRVRAGGQGRAAADISARHHAVSAMDSGACNECKTSTIGASFAINAASKNKKLAGGIPRRDVDARDGQDVDRDRLSADRHQGRREEFHGSARRLFHRADGPPEGQADISSASRATW